MAFLSFIFIPFYIHFLGIEGYGLIAFYSILLAMLSRLNLGLKATMIRELAQRSTLQNGYHEMRDLVRSIEVVYWSLAILLMLLIIIFSPLIADYWINFNSLNRTSVVTSIMLMGVVFAFEFIFSMYVGGLIGLQRQVLQNVIVVITSTLRFAGGVLVLWLISPTIEAFFLWQALVTFLQLGLGVYYLWHALNAPEAAHPKFRLSLLRSIRRFASGMMGNSILGFLLLQVPLIVLSKMLPLEEFAYYSLAMQVAFLLLFIIGPIVTAVSPQLCALIAINDERALTKLYHQSSQIVAVVMFPIASLLCLFSKEFLFMWTGDPQIVEQAYLLVTILALGSMLNGLVNMPSSLMVAYGWTKLILQLNSLAVLFLLPLLFFAVPKFGAISAAVIWLMLNLMWVLIGVMMLHRRYLIGELKRWYIHDVVVQLVICMSIAMGVRLLVEMPEDRWLIVMILFATWSCSVAASAAVSTEVRSAVVFLLQSRGYKIFS